MNNLVFLVTVFPMLILISQCQSKGYSDPHHCNGYDACYTIGMGITMRKMEYLLHMRVSAIVKTGAPVIIPGFAPGMMVAIFSMDKEVSSA